MKDRGRLLREYPFPETSPPRPHSRPRSPTLRGEPLPLPEIPPRPRRRVTPLPGVLLPPTPPTPPTPHQALSRSRTQTLPGAPLPRPPSQPPSIEETVVVDTDPNDEITEVMTSPRAECTECGYRARHVQTFLDGLCGLCRTTVQGSEQ